MKAFGYLAHRTAICEGCGKRLPTESDPVIVWGHSLDGLAYAAYCEPCTRKLRVKVVDRVVGEQWCPPPPHLCSDCGRALPAPDDGGWVLGALTAEGLACFCNDCRLQRGLPTAATFRPESSDEPAPSGERLGKAGLGTCLLVGVLSDTHGTLDPAILELFADCDHIVHAGDVGDRTVLERLRRLARVTAVRGNCDSGSLIGLPDAATVTLEDVTLLVRHDRVMVEALDAIVLAAMRDAGRGVVICGHTHMPATSRKDGVLYLNPGSASLRRYEVPRSVALLRIERQDCTAEIHELGCDVLL
jgi:putative phosphoesterase